MHFDCDYGIRCRRFILPYDLLVIGFLSSTVYLYFSLFVCVCVCTITNRLHVSIDISFSMGSPDVLMCVCMFEVFKIVNFLVHGIMNVWVLFGKEKV